MLRKIRDTDQNPAIDRENVRVDINRFLSPLEGYALSSYRWVKRPAAN